LLWFLWGVLLLIFVAVLLASAIRTLAVPFAQRTPFGMSAAIIVVVLLIVLVLSGTGLMIGTQLSNQLGELWIRLPEFAAGAEKFIAQTPLGTTLLRLLPNAETIFSGLTAGTALTAATTTLGVLATIRLPRLVFRLNAPGLCPGICGSVSRRLSPARRERAGRHGRVASCLVGRAIRGDGGRGGHHVGRPSPARCSARPRSCVSGVLVGVHPGRRSARIGGPSHPRGTFCNPMLGLWVALLYLAVQQFEGYVLLPLLQRWAVHLPPALYLIGIVAFGVLFGWIGVLLAAPLMVATAVWVREIYMESILEPAGK
jgi:hypothetical protein